MKTLLAIGIIATIGAAASLPILGSIGDRGGGSGPGWGNGGSSRGAPGPIAGAGLIALAGAAGAAFIARRRKA